MKTLNLTNMIKIETRTVKLGVVGVDSGQLIICDPCYVESEYKRTKKSEHGYNGRIIYKCKTDGKLWQYCYGEKKSAIENVNPFTGTYGDVIPQYGKCPNDLIAEGIFEVTDIDASSYIPDGEFSYRGICKATCEYEDQGGQLNYKLGHAGAAVAFSSGLGDGTYEVFAEIVDTKSWGERVKKVWVELISDEDVRAMIESDLAEQN